MFHAVLHVPARLPGAGAAVARRARRGGRGRGLARPRRAPDVVVVAVVVDVVVVVLAAVAEQEEEDRSSPESEDRDTVPPAFRPLARVRLGWEHYPRDESGERIPYVETEHEAREREHLEFLSKGPTPLYGLNGDMVAMGGPPSDDGDDEAALAEQAEEQERLEQEEAMKRHITQHVRAFHERLQFGGGDDDDAPEWPSADEPGLLPGWSHMSTPGDDEEEEDEGEEELEEADYAPLPSPPQPSPAPPTPQPSPDPSPPQPSPAPSTSTRYPTPDWLKDGPTGPRPAGLI